MAVKAKYANVIVDISHEKLDKTFQYLIPAEMATEIFPGVRVEIPFGRANRLIKGYVIEATDESACDERLLKQIHSVSKDSLPIESQLIQLAWWIKENYGSTMNQALKTVIPVKTKVRPKTKKYIELDVSDKEAAGLLKIYGNTKKFVARYRLMEELSKEKMLPWDIVTDKLNISDSTLKSMEKSGIIRISVETSLRDTVHYHDAKSDPVSLNTEQAAVVNRIKKDMESGDMTPHLIFGVTGSGKTEIYISLIEEVISRGRQAIVLIPEIALTYQTVMRFYKRFGDRVSFINSRLSQGEKHDQFEKAVNGDIDIMIGPRSAVFTPFKKIGIIIIDEEHESAYKSDMVPKYHARETAIERARMTDALVVMGSATPSVESYYKASNNIFRLSVLENRATVNDLPQVHLVDLREELKNGNRSIFSDRLLNLMKDRLEKNRQIILFINRRGYAGFVSCRSCGEPVKCIHCDVGMTAHNDGNLVCHYCGYRIPTPKACPECGSKYIAAFGIGTQKVEAYVKKIFPDSRVLRMDTDTTSQKGGHEKILAAFANHEADILIGTQMIVKGHDFPLVSLVGVIAADLSLYASDFRAAEKTFQLLTQAAGRSGRGTDKGEVVIQTYSPDNYCITYAANQDYPGFYQQEILYRKLSHYPPLTGMVAVIITSPDKTCADNLAAFIAALVDRLAAGEGLQVIGPSDAGIAKIKDIYRKVIYLKHEENDILVKIKNQIEKEIKENGSFGQAGVQFDFDPMNNY
ncbi:replication restart helicase PriA [Parasporobacterium paucivorans]|uniref:Replication restart protein PriA n=1 Tax=Parasporobacterium paucivorans DSM 15970 TaxID=1122934 RepID=A0A1M6ESS7_9FIRM|nr:primosomal protein N' [Parasporobacterium paucivorans]SHI88443.1 replication restart DNA helicase PriA [Parasporobacterium paucivorans DSM 15970]